MEKRKFGKLHKEDYEITDTILDILNGECPSCGGILRKFKDWKLRCNNCGMDIAIESRNGRLFTFGFMGAVLIFALGYIVALVI